jgi:ABC-type nitrate/sulfonate/bicarbonate transport system substrate-binding protein
VLVGCEAVIPNRSLFWLRRTLAEPARIAAIVATLDNADRWIGANQGQAGNVFAEAIGGGLSAEQWAAGLASRTWGLVPADAGVLAEQQHEADLLARYGLLPNAIDLTDAAAP